MKKKVILVTSNQLGKGNEELGETIMETFFTLLKQQTDLPHAVFFMNSGVLTLTNDSLVSLHLKELEDRGVSMLACKTCVDFYKVEDNLAAGEISSMAKFVELASHYEIVTL